MMRLTRGVKPEQYGVIFYSSSDRQPKCELLYVARNEAIGVPLLPLRQAGHGKVKHRDGYLVQVANRQCVEYVEPHRKAMIEVDFGNSVGIYIETLNGWLTSIRGFPLGQGYKHTETTFGSSVLSVLEVLTQLRHIDLACLEQGDTVSTVLSAIRQAVHP